MNGLSRTNGARTSILWQGARASSRWRARPMNLVPHNNQSIPMLRDQGNLGASRSCWTNRQLCRELATWDFKAQARDNLAVCLTNNVNKSAGRPGVMSDLFGDYDVFFPKGFRSRKCVFANSVDVCLIPGTEDRFKEAVYFASQMESGYHDPQKFRYSLGAFLAAYGSISELLTKELERKKRWSDWKKHLEAIPDVLKINEYGPALTRARNINVHQKSVFDGSTCHIGLYRGRQHKLGITSNIDWDIPSADLIDTLWDSEFGEMMLDKEHAAIGEQYGVRRTYHLSKISDQLPASDKGLDVLQIVRRALLRTHDILGLTHTIDGEVVGLLSGEQIVNDLTYMQVTILLESDVYPHLPQVWNWPDLGEELRPVANF